MDNLDLKPHTHNGVDSPEIPASSLINVPQASVDSVSGTAGGTYGATEQTIINDLVDTVNDLIAKLKAIQLLEE